QVRPSWQHRLIFELKALFHFQLNYVRAHPKHPFQAFEVVGGQEIKVVRDFLGFFSLSPAAQGIFFFEDPEGIRLIDTNLSQPVRVSLEGKLQSISGPIAEGIVTAWTRTNGGHVFYGVNFYGKKVFFKSFPVEGPFCYKVWDSSFLIGILDQILYFEVKAG
ncbi:MAG TPA: hypothetical protein PLG79_14065, partial [Spirochaetales bacterium]|nr:hypothetical protein [Spirochaetales bacterium]